MHIDFYIELYKKDGNYEKVEELKNIKCINKELKRLRAGDIITFDELIKLPDGYKYISNCNGSVDLEEMTNLEVKNGIISWSQSTGEPEIELGEGDVKNITHRSDSDYKFTIYHILKKNKKS